MKNCLVAWTAVWKIPPCINECDTTDDYDEFKFDLLLLEADEKVSVKPRKAAVQVDKPEASRLDKM